MKNKIIQNTITFIIIIVTINILNAIFDSANSLVAVTIIVAAMIAMGRGVDPTPIRSFIILAIINVTLGLLSKLASVNIWWGIFINFISLASVGYFLSFNLTKMLVVPFGLQYLFMLYAPVSGIVYGKRILELIFGAAIVVLVQWLANRKKGMVQKSQVFTFKKETDQYQTIKLFNKVFTINTVRASYAIRIGILTAVTAFIAGYFKLAEGRWMSYTVFSLTELYSEHCKVRSKQRMEGTIIGGVIVLVLFTIFRSSIWRALILLLAGYLNPFANNYRDSMILVTISAVAAIGLTSGGALMPTFERLFFVGVGCILSLLANRFILHTPLEQ
ncbi:MAG: FUSC family protein [Cellulosilyticum sp.]|nr:FUSC family protein [Cellulosilyticum sp.]